MLNTVYTAAARGWRVPTAETPWQWGDKNIIVDHTSPFPGEYKSIRTPWAREIMEKGADNRIRRIVIRASTQSSKTQTEIVLLCYWIDNDPGPILWILAIENEIKTFVNTRLKQTFRNCKGVADKLPTERTDNKTTEINFPNAPLVLRGSNSDANLDGKPARYLILEEAHNYPPGSVTIALERTSGYWNAREIISANGGDEGGEVDIEFLSGDQRHYYVPCPHCKHEQELVFDQVKWDENEITRPNGEWSLDKIEPTVRYECIACGKRIEDNPSVRRKMAEKGKWVPHNKNSPSNRVSYTWSSLLVPWIPWHRTVTSFLQAHKAFKMGNVKPLRAWVTRKMGKTWSETAFYSSGTKATGGYDPKAPYEKKHIRFMTIDCQLRTFWYVIRDWALDGESRLISFGEVNTEGDLLAIQELHGVLDHCVGVDAGDHQNIVFEMCCRRGWQAMKGSKSESFQCVNDEGERLMLPYRWPLLRGDPGVGKSEQGRQSCPFVIWSNLSIKDLLSRLKGGKGVPYGIYEDVDPEYLRQMSSEHRIKQPSGRPIWVQIGRRQNHIWDCECQQVVMAMIEGVLANPFAMGDEPSDTRPEEKATT